MTERQELILAFIRVFHEAHGYSPTLRQIAAATHTSSISVVSYNLDRLEEDGYIQRDEMVSRSIRVTEKGLAK